MKLIGKINLGNTYFGESISHSCTYLFWPCSESPLLNLLEGQMKFLRSRSLCWFQWLHHPVWERWLVCLKLLNICYISRTPTGMLIKHAFFMYSGYIQYNYIYMYVYLHPEINSDDWSKTQWYSVFITEYQYKK